MFDLKKPVKTKFVCLGCESKEEGPEKTMKWFLDEKIDHILSFFGKKKLKIDIAFLSKIIDMQDKLEQIFPNQINIGWKYNDNGRNLWANDILIDIKNILKT